MAGEAPLVLADIEVAQLALIAAVAFIAATVSGMSGVGGGLLVAIFVTPIVGVKAIVPTIGVAMLVAHVARVWVYRQAIVWRPALVMLAGAIPAVVASARLYVELPADAIATILGVFLLASIPLRRLMAKRELRIGSRSLAVVGGTYGFLAGTTIGGGILVIPALLGSGLAGMALLATDAVVGLSVLAAKTLVFGGFDVLTPDLFLAGSLIGLCMIPGTYLARWLILRTPLHARSGHGARGDLWRLHVPLAGGRGMSSNRSGSRPGWRCRSGRHCLLSTKYISAAGVQGARRRERLVRPPASTGRHETCASFASSRPWLLRCPAWCSAPARPPRISITPTAP